MRPVGKQDGLDKRGRQAREIGIYTTIPAMLVVGPILGYLLGRWAASHWGHDNLCEALGALMGLAASARQIWLILRRHGTNT